MNPRDTPQEGLSKSLSCIYQVLNLHLFTLYPILLGIFEFLDLQVRRGREANLGRIVDVIRACKFRFGGVNLLLHAVAYSGQRFLRVVVLQNRPGMF